MPYGRRRRGYYRRGRRGRRLSNYNIATKTSAKSQSKQIYSLKKRINWIQRRFKPEIKIQQRGLEVTPLPIPADDVGTYFNNIYPVTQHGNTDIVPDPDNYEQDRFQRLQSFTLYGSIHYEGIKPNSSPVTTRIVIIQAKIASPQIYQPADIFTSMNDTASTFASTMGPLQNGLSRFCNVLYDHKYTISYQRSVCNIRVVLNRLAPCYQDANSAQSGGDSDNNNPKGAIYVFYSLHVHDSDPGTSTTPTMHSMFYKLAYTSN